MIAPRRREYVLQQVARALEADDRIAAAILIGSGAEGFTDALSDLDVLVVVRADAGVDRVRTYWGDAIPRLLPVLHRARTPFTEANSLNIFILDGLLELDMSFAAAASFQLRGYRGRMLFDRAGLSLQRGDVAEHPAPRFSAELWRFNQACHRVMECRKALYRRNLLQATLILDELRAMTAQLAGLVHLGSQRQRDLDRLPPEVLATLAGSIVPIDAQDLQRALRALTTLMLDHARQVYGRAGVEFPDKFATQLQAVVQHAYPPAPRSDDSA